MKQSLTGVAGNQGFLYRARSDLAKKAETREVKRSVTEESVKAQDAIVSTFFLTYFLESRIGHI